MPWCHIPFNWWAILCWSRLSPSFSLHLSLCVLLLTVSFSASLFSFYSFILHLCFLSLSPLFSTRTDNFFSIADQTFHWHSNNKPKFANERLSPLICRVLHRYHRFTNWKHFKLLWGVFNKWRYAILDNFGPTSLIMLFITRALLLSSQNHWSLSFEAVTSLKDDHFTKNPELDWSTWSLYHLQLVLWRNKYIGILF